VQLEAGAFPTSYISTSGSAVTRAGDAFAVPTSAGGGWYTAGIGTLLANGTIPYAPPVSKYPGTVSFGTGTNLIASYINGGSTSGAFAIYSGGTIVYATTATAGTYTAAGSFKSGTAFQVNDANAALNGTGGTAGTPASIPAAGSLYVGSENGGPWNGWVNRITYFPTRQPNAALADYTR
jgi:hypothetical protein